ncbi:MAG: DEAD/DEAH box helicase [Chloroflexota bacterium]
MKFEDLSLDARILAGVRSAGFETPTPIQEQAIPQILEGKDVLGLAQTGTGKTAAFMLPILNRLTQGPLRRVRALVVAPTRELAEQIHETTVELGKKTKIRSASIYGGVGKGPQISAIRQGTEVIVACPGRLLDHINEGNINLSHLEVLVLDEADRMFDMGFLPDIRRLLSHLPKKRQNLFFSATMPKDIRKLADDVLHHPVTVQIGMIAPAKTVSHALYPVPQNRKKGLLFSLLKQAAIEKVLIFTRTKRRARFLARDLEKRGYKASALQGNMAQNRRQEAINGFRGSKYDILVATDIAARGIDVAEISHVINFDMPDTVDAYTHRIGRTGRAQQVGEALTFMVHDDESMVRDIEKLLGKKIERRRMESFDYNSSNMGEPPSEPGRSRQESSSRPGQHRQNRNGEGQSTRSRSRNGSHDSKRQGEKSQESRQRNSGHQGNRRQDSRRQDSRQQESRRSNARRHNSRQQDSRQKGNGSYHESNNGSSHAHEPSTTLGKRRYSRSPRSASPDHEHATSRDRLRGQRRNGSNRNEDSQDSQQQVDPRGSRQRANRKGNQVDQNVHSLEQGKETDFERTDAHSSSPVEDIHQSEQATIPSNGRSPQQVRSNATGPNAKKAEEAQGSKKRVRLPRKRAKKK